MSGFRERFARFMIGRYGMDRLGQFLNAVACVFLAAGLFSRSSWVNIAALVFFIFMLFSCVFKKYRKAFRRKPEV